MSKRSVVPAALIALALSGTATAAEAPKRGADPSTLPSAPTLLDLGRWLNERFESLGRVFPKVGPRGGTRNDTGSTAPATTCDPSRNHCPIG